MAPTLRVQIVGDATGLNAALAKASGAVSGFGASMGKAGKQVMSTGKTLTTHVSLPLIAIGAASVKMANDFDQSMTRMVGLAGVSQKQVDSWGKQIMELGPKVAKSPRELAEAMYQISSSGVDTSKAMDVLTASAKASTAGLGDTATVADAVTSVMNAYGEANMSASDATNTLVATVREGKGEASDFAPVIGNVVSIASQLGVSFNDVGAALAGMTRLGTDAATSATQLQAFFSQLLKVTPKQADALKSVGLSAAGLRTELKEKGLLATLETLRTAFHGNTAAMAAAFPNVRALRAVLALMGTQAESTRGIFQRMGDTTGSLGKAFDAAREKSGFKFDQLKASAEVAGVSLGMVLMPALQRVADWLARLATAFTGLSPGTKELISQIGAVAIATGPVVFAFGGLIRIVGAFVRALGGIGTALSTAFAMGPLGAVLVGLGVLVAGVAGQFIQAKIAAANLAATWKQVQNEGDVLAGTLSTLQGANLNVTEAQHQVTASLHAAQAAQATYNTFVEKGTQNTLAGKQAHDQAVAAWDTHTRAVQQHKQALTEQQAAQAKATTEARAALNPILQMANGEGQIVRFGGPLIPLYSKMASGLKFLTAGHIDWTKNASVSTDQAHRWGVGVETAGRQAYAAAVNNQKLPPTLRTAREAMGLLTEAAGHFAREGGKLPTNIGQIVGAAKKLHPGLFQATFTAWINAAKDAGVKIPGWMQQAVGKTGTAATNVANAAKRPVQSIPGVYSTAGSSAGAGLASGISAQIPSIAAAAQAAANAAKVPLSKKFGSTPAQWGHDQVGGPLAQGIAKGILDGMPQVEGATDKVKLAMRKKAEDQARELLALAARYGKDIGMSQAMGIVRGLVQGTPSVVQQGRQQMEEMRKQMMADLREKILSDAGRIGDAAGQLADQALANFDAKVAAWKNPLAAKLAGMQFASEMASARGSLATAMASIFSGDDLVAQLNIEDLFGAKLGTELDAAMAKAATLIGGAKTDAALSAAASRASALVTKAIQDSTAEATAAAQTAVDNAKAAYTTAQANLQSANAALAAAQAGGNEDAIKQAQDAQQAAETAMGKASTALSTAVQNQKTLEGAIQAEVDRATGVLVTKTDERHTQIDTRQRIGLQAQLTHLITELAKHPAQWANMAVKINTLLDKFGVEHVQPAGKTWATKFADGIRSGIPESVAAARELARRTGAVLPSTGSPLKPAKTGPLAFHPYDMGKQWTEEMSAGLGSRTGTVLGGGPLATATPVAGGITVNVTVPGTLVGSGGMRELAEVVRNEFYDIRRRNGTLGF